MDAKLKETILNPIFKGNPITVLVLGICSSLAVTVTMKGALVMALSVIAVTGISSLILSLLRNTIPSRVRIIVQLVVVAMDRNGLLIDVLDKIAEEKINIVKLNTVVDGPEARIFVTINISGREQLDRTCERILRVKDVVDVIRN
jgi:Na+-transporting NADH:ubiquinone oxidoreductase subunit D